VALVGTGVNPGFVMDKLVVTLAAFPAHRACESIARRGCVEAAAVAAEKNRRGDDGRRISRASKSGRDQARRIARVGAMVADSLNLPVEQIIETIEPRISTERVQTEY